MAPFAYLKSLGSKFHILSSKSFTNRELAKNALNLLFHLIFGLPILALNFIMDSAYFWMFNVSKHVQSNEVFTDNSELTFASFYEVLLLCKRFLSQKIYSINAIVLIKLIRRQMQVQQKIEFLVFGQPVDPVSRYNYNKLREAMLKDVKKQLDSLGMQDFKKKVDEAYAN